MNKQNTRRKPTKGERKLEDESEQELRVLKNQEWRL
jgi:hypothetical protein